MTCTNLVVPTSQLKDKYIVFNKMETISNSTTSVDVGYHEDNINKIKSIILNLRLYTTINKLVEKYNELMKKV